jgi:hypothetical protein
VGRTAFEAAKKALPSTAAAASNAPPPADERSRLAVAARAALVMCDDTICTGGCANGVINGYIMALKAALATKHAKTPPPAAAQTQTQTQQTPQAEEAARAEELASLGFQLCADDARDEGLTAMECARGVGQGIWAALRSVNASLAACTAAAAVAAKEAPNPAGRVGTFHRVILQSKHIQLMTCMYV